ncbi:hypothetical protein BJ875DRAFT_155054 [Amylocarpus encephaloides]|uniref:Conidiation-specific protein 8 n=1 Tax=Amylocarpus encephaloides TaxID=45428 RepID=A0A9P7YBV9_9HELO|nr:hypothetical protein BJ875DRAFT_155054 [Amylocarpus encephaloides]
MDSGKTTAVDGGSGTTGTPANNVGGERRSSQSKSLFSGLMNQKRGSIDATAEARRVSFAEQKPTPGILGRIWNTYTSGSPPK